MNQALDVGAAAAGAAAAAAHAAAAGRAEGAAVAAHPADPHVLAICMAHNTQI